LQPLQGAFAARAVSRAAAASYSGCTPRKDNAMCITAHHLADLHRLGALARRRAQALRRDAFDDLLDGLARPAVDAVRVLRAYAASFSGSRRAPRSRSTSAPASAGKASPRQMMC
jgi:hypothetical protein